MRTLAIVVMCGWSAARAEGPKPTSFGRADAGRVPAGWAAAKTGAGAGSVWAVTADDTAPGKSGFALAQTAAGPRPLFNLCFRDGSTFRDGELSVAVKAVAGTIDQGGGLVWRLLDADNYYVCRYNPLEKNFRVYHVKAGVRTQLATQEDLAVGTGEWFTVSVRHAGDAIECALDGKTLLRVTDHTFPAGGQVGVWSKADARSHFDLFRVAPAK